MGHETREGCAKSAHQKPDGRAHIAAGALGLRPHLGHCADGYTTKHTVDQLAALVSAGRDCDGCNKEFGVLIEGTTDVYGAHSFNMGNSAPYARWGHYLPGKIDQSPNVDIFPECALGKTNLVH